MSRFDVAMNVVLYKGAWLGGVFGAASGSLWLCAVGVSAALCWHLMRAREPGRELQLIALAVVVGAGVESLLVATGWVRMADGLLVGGFLPLWMVALWASFATTLNVALRAFRTRYALVSLVGFIGAPLAYIAGARLGALEWVVAAPALLLIAVAWAILMPLLMHAAQRCDGYAAAA